MCVCEREREIEREREAGRETGRETGREGGGKGGRETMSPPSKTMSPLRRRHATNEAATCDAFEVNSFFFLISLEPRIE